MHKSYMVLAAAALIGCSDKDAGTARPATGADAIAEVAAAKSLPPEKFVSTTAGFDLELPGVWRGHYIASEHADSTRGARLVVEFKLLPDSGSKAPRHTLMTVRVYNAGGWAILSKKPGRPVGTKVGERGEDVFVLSIPEANPYPATSPEAPVFDRLIISLSQGGQQVHLTPR